MYTRVKYIQKNIFVQKKILKGTWLVFDLETLLNWIPHNHVIASLNNRNPDPSGYGC